MAIDLADDKLELAKGMGATTPTMPAVRTVSTRSRRPRRRRRLRLRACGIGQGDGARVQDHAARRHHGHRGPAAADAHAPDPQVNLVAEERTIKGSYIGTCVPVRELPRYIALYRQGRMPVDRLLTGRLQLDEINLGFDRLREGKAVRQVVVF